MADIEWLKKRVDDLGAQLRDARNELRQALLDASPVKIGDTVIAKRDGKKYRVIDLDPTWNPPWVVGNQTRTDGSFGTARRNLFSDYTVESE